MTQRAWWSIVGLVVVVSGVVAPRAYGGDLGGVSGRVEVDSIVVEYTPSANRLSIQVRLVTGLLVDHDVSEPADVANVLRMVETFGGGRARMFLIVQSDAVTGFQLAVSGGRLYERSEAEEKKKAR